MCEKETGNKQKNIKKRSVDFGDLPGRVIGEQIIFKAPVKIKQSAARKRAVETWSI